MEYYKPIGLPKQSATWEKLQMDGSSFGNFCFFP